LQLLTCFLLYHFVAAFLCLYLLTAFLIFFSDYLMT
jgi:hypothetical protein